MTDISPAAPAAAAPSIAAATTRRRWVGVLVVATAGWLVFTLAAAAQELPHRRRGWIPPREWRRRAG